MRRQLRIYRKHCLIAIFRINFIAYPAAGHKENLMIDGICQTCQEKILDTPPPLL